MPKKLDILAKIAIVFLAGYLFLGMFPAINEGDLLFSNPYRHGKTEIRKGMIVGFRERNAKGEPTNFFLHRVIEISERGVVTKGDNILFSDGLIEYKEIESVCFAHWPLSRIGLGAVKSFLFRGAFLKEKSFGSLPLSFYLITFLFGSFLFLVIWRKRRERSMIKQAGSS
jgi:hypothetical protein